MYPLPPPPHPPSRFTEEERAERVPGYARRWAIIERKLVDAPPPLLLLRPTAGQEVSSIFPEGWRASDIEDKLTQCFFCREDGWEGARQAAHSRTGTGTRICLNCFAVMSFLGYTNPMSDPSTIVVADKRVPKRNPPRKQPGR